MGDPFLQEQKYAQAISFYNKAIHINNIFQRYGSLQSKIFENKAIAEYHLEKFEEACQSLKKAKKWAMQLLVLPVFMYRDID